MEIVAAELAGRWVRFPVDVAEGVAPVSTARIGAEGIDGGACGDEAVHCISTRDHEGARPRLALHRSREVHLIGELHAAHAAGLDDLDARTRRERLETRQLEGRGPVAPQREVGERDARLRAQVGERAPAEGKRPYARHAHEGRRGLRVEQRSERSEQAFGAGP